jgi:ArsR family transcriptional regulator
MNATDFFFPAFPITYDLFFPSPLTQSDKTLIIVSMIRNIEIKDTTEATRKFLEDLKIYELQAEICIALANPKRLQILNLLKNGEMSAGEMVKAMQIPKANLSQHLSILKQKGILSSRREGTSIYYKITNPKITDACSIMRSVLMDSLEKQENIAQQVRKRKPDTV